METNKGGGEEAKKNEEQFLPVYWGCVRFDTSLGSV